MIVFFPELIPLIEEITYVDRCRYETKAGSYLYGSVDICHNKLYKILQILIDSELPFYDNNHKCMFRFYGESITNISKFNFLKLFIVDEILTKTEIERREMLKLLGMV